MATTISKNWGSTYQHDWDGATSWTTGSPTTAAKTLSDTEVKTAAVNLVTNGYEGTQVTLDLNYAATPTDEVTINVYGSIDGNDFDDTPLFSIQGDHDTDPQQITFIIKDVAYFKIGFVQSGSTDSHSLDTLYYRPWNWQSA